MENKDIKNKKKGKSFWTSLHGILTGCAATITIIIGLITLYRTGILKPTSKPPSIPPITKSSPTPEPTPYDIANKGKRLSELKALLSRNLELNPNKTNVALVIESQKTKSGFSPGNILYNYLRSEQIHIIINFFKEDEFKSKGFFKEIYDGNTAILKLADAFSKINYILLGKLNYSFRKGTLNNDLVSCDINFSFKLINKNAEIIRSDNISVVGPGFTKDSALERGLEILAEKYSDRILKLVL